jgi:hypothetical protein
MILTSLLVVAGLAVVGPQPASADAYGRLSTSQDWCLAAGEGGTPPASPHAARCTDTPDNDWHLQIVARVGDSPRYSVRNSWFNICLVAFASSGRVGTYQCNSAWADQVWAFEYVRPEPGTGAPQYWLRNKHSGKCLALNESYTPEAFMTTCGLYRDQLWFAPF